MSKMRLQPSNFIRIFKILRSTRSFYLAKKSFRGGVSKSILNFILMGGSFSFGESGQCVGVFKNQSIDLDRMLGKEFHILESLEAIEFAGWSLMIEEDGDIILKKDQRAIRFNLYDSVLNMLECFIEYECLRVKGATVIDIGAFKGESALFFWGKGANKVLAFEPFPDFYKQAVANIRKNGLSEIIKVFNTGVGNQVYRFEDNNCTGSLLSINDIKKLILENKLEGGDVVLKIDCEGCEYDLYRDPKSVMDWKSIGIKEFVMEYHEGGEIFSLIKNWRASGYNVYRVLKKNSIVGIIYGYIE